MRTVAEILAEIEACFGDELDLQIRYCEAVAPHSKAAQRNLTLLRHAQRLRSILIRTWLNERVGAKSPYFNDADLIGRDSRTDYSDYCQYRIQNDPYAAKTPRESAPRRQSRPSTSTSRLAAALKTLQHRLAAGDQPHSRSPKTEAQPTACDHARAGLPAPLRGVHEDTKPALEAIPANAAMPEGTTEAEPADPNPENADTPITDEQPGEHAADIKAAANPNDAGTALVAASINILVQRSQKPQRRIKPTRAQAPTDSSRPSPPSRLRVKQFAVSNQVEAGPGGACLRAAA